MESKKFQKTVEDFVCQNCGREVKGSGYTNHCPNCLWSRHVDINPGDRESRCGGAMKPIKTFTSGKDIYILHRCEKCGHEMKVRTAKNDNMDVIISFSNTV